MPIYDVDGNELKTMGDTDGTTNYPWQAGYETDGVSSNLIYNGWDGYIFNYGNYAPAWAVGGVSGFAGQRANYSSGSSGPTLVSNYLQCASGTTTDASWYPARYFRTAALIDLKKFTKVRVYAYNAGGSYGCVALGLGTSTSIPNNFGAWTATTGATAVASGKYQTRDMTVTSYNGKYYIYVSWCCGGPGNFNGNTSGSATGRIYYIRCF